MKNFEDNDVVTEKKVLFWLKEDVSKRPLKGKARAAAAAALGVPVATASAGYLGGYVTAMVDLWDQQRQGGRNSHPSLREERVLGRWLKAEKAKRADRDRAMLKDRGEGTILDGYNVQQMERLSPHIWQQEGENVALAFRTLVDFLLGHFLMQRSEIRLALQLPDLVTYELHNEGPTPCFPVIAIMRQGKTNAVGRVEHVGAYRNKNLAICPVSALAFYLFWRWEFSGEAFPDFADRGSWYGTYLLRRHTTGQKQGKGKGKGKGRASTADGLEMETEAAAEMEAAEEEEAAEMEAGACYDHGKSHTSEGR